jgi:hypothetical protein
MEPVGQPKIVLRVEANGHAHSKYLLEEIKRHVRIEGGGDVQTAFGRE